MKVFNEMNWNDVFTSAWSGAKYAAERLQEEGKGDEFMELIEELYPDGIDRTALNDIMWFDRATGFTNPSVWLPKNRASRGLSLSAPPHFIFYVFRQTAEKEGTS